MKTIDMEQFVTDHPQLRIQIPAETSLLKNQIGNNPSIIQWNARSLNNAKLAKFRSQLSTFNPSIALVSKTH